MLRELAQFGSAEMAFMLLVLKDNDLHMSIAPRNESLKLTTGSEFALVTCTDHL